MCVTIEAAISKETYCMKNRTFRFFPRLTAVLTVVCLLLTACGRSATLHEEGDNGYIPLSASPITVKGTAAKAYFIYDCDADEFAATHGGDRLIYPASVTKLLTALYALTLLEPDRVITPGDELERVGAGSSIAYIKSHHTLTANMLVQGMLIPSGNDAAYALAAAAGSTLDGTPGGGEAVDRFVESMNDYAKSLGLCSSSFTVPDGFAGDEHYSSLEDMAIVAKYAFANETIVNFCSMATADVTYESGHTNTWVNTTLFLDEASEFYDARVLCGKTGSLEDYYNVVFLAEVDGKRYVVGVFGCSDADARFEDGIRIMDAIASNGKTAA